jgi:hypothetical protein
VGIRDHFALSYAVKEGCGNTHFVFANQSVENHMPRTAHDPPPHTEAYVTRRRFDRQFMFPIFTNTDNFEGISPRKTLPVSASRQIVATLEGIGVHFVLTKRLGFRYRGSAH